MIGGEEVRREILRDVVHKAAGAEVRAADAVERHGADLVAPRVALRADHVDVAPALFRAKLADEPVAVVDPRHLQPATIEAEERR